MREDLAEPRRFLFALVAIGFFFAPSSDVPLRSVAWSLGVAAVAWSGQQAGTGSGGVLLWLACSVAGAALAVRGGSRALHYYLPKAGNELGAARQREIRGQLQVSVALFIVAYLAEVSALRAFSLWGAAAFFVRYLLLQAKHLGIQSPRVLPARGIVPGQRWPLLLVFLLVGMTELPGAMIGTDGRGRLLVTSALLLVLAALVFVLALVRSGWPKSFVRRASFWAGIGLAVGLAAVVVELEGWGPRRYAAFANAWVGFFVVLPLVSSVTRLFEPWPRVAFLVPPPILSVMMAPLAAVSRGRDSASSGFLAAFAALTVLYQLVVAIRRRSDGRVFFVVSLGALVFLLFVGPGESARVWLVFLLSLGFVLYAVDLFQRSISGNSRK